jgi:hypothetical protein
MASIHSFAISIASILCFVLIERFCDFTYILNNHIIPISSIKIITIASIIDVAFLFFIILLIDFNKYFF